MTSGRAKLPRVAEALLASFPDVVTDFEAQAQAIDARLARAELGDALTLDVLAAPHLEPEPGEPPFPSSIRASVPRASLVELARRSLQPDEDEEATALAKQLLSSAPRSRKPDAELTERVRATRAANYALPAAAPVSPSSDVTLRSQSNPTAVSTGVYAWLGVAAAVALAAGLALASRSGPSRDARNTAQAVKVEGRAASGETVAPQLGTENPLPPLASSEVRPRVDAPPSAPARSADEKAPEAQATAPRAPASARAKAPVADAKPALAHAPTSSAAPKGATTAETELEPPLQPAEGRPGIELPEKPSQGAVSSALGQVMGKARSCLAGQAGTVNAAVTFGSNGVVENVVASGPAASCIRSALSRARVQPFARDSFRTDAVVRPP